MLYSALKIIASFVFRIQLKSSCFLPRNETDFSVSYRRSCGGTRQQKFPTVSSVQNISPKRKAERPNEPSIFLRSFRQVFERRRTWQQSRTPKEHACIGDIEK